MSRRGKIGLYNSTTAFSIAVLIYVLFRHSNGLNFLEDNVEVFKRIRDVIFVETSEKKPWNLIKYYFPDLLWAYAVMSYATIIHRDNMRAFIHSLLVTSSFELLQITDFTSGTFDYFDLLSQIMGIIFAYFSIKLQHKCINTDK